MPLPTVHEAAKEPRRRILCVDGGGILGTFPAAFFAELEQHLDNPIGSYFDLIAGTSTGGIIAIALYLGHRASEILDFYEERGPDVFGEDRGALANLLCRALRGCRWLVRHRHDSDALRAALHEILGTTRIGDARTRLVIPAWNPVARSVYIYKTAHHPRLRTDYRLSAVDAALATSAAPTYLRHHITQHDVGLLDGGVWANMAKLLTGHEHDRTSIHRINHTVAYNAYKMDDTRIAQDLKGLGHTMGRDRLPVLDPVFFDGPAEVFEPIYQPDEERHAN